MAAADVELSLTALRLRTRRQEAGLTVIAWVIHPVLAPETEPHEERSRFVTKDGPEVEGDD